MFMFLLEIKVEAHVIMSCRRHGSLQICDHNIVWYQQADDTGTSKKIMHGPFKRSTAWSTDHSYCV